MDCQFHQAHRIQNNPVFNFSTMLKLNINFDLFPLTESANLDRFPKPDSIAKSN